MDHHSKELELDILQLTRREISALMLLGRNRLDKQGLIVNASMLDKSIQRQVPNSKTSERVRLIKEAAAKMGDPSPDLASARMLIFYRFKLNEDASTEAKNEDDNDGADDDGEGANLEPLRRLVGTIKGSAFGPSRS